MTNYTLITGASQGIGAEFARIAAREGHNLILTARNESSLQSLASELDNSHGIEAIVLPADLAEPGAAKTLWDRATDGRRVDRLINNAGFGLNGPLTDFPFQDHADLLEVNVNALTRLTYLAIDHMMANDGGRILNVASILAYLPGPYFSTYGGSKAFVLAFSEGLSKELQGSSVSVTALCPGTTRTGFFDRAQMEGTKAAASSMQTPGEVAKTGWEAMTRRARTVVPGTANRALVFATRFAPRGALAATAAKLFSKA
ncbi:MAG: SDR family oxidoreductase [Dinoroseobacter sp.]|nr:SDR family oxidoreductase [Dinoroseobacter sp.]